MKNGSLEGTEVSLLNSNLSAERPCFWYHYYSRTVDVVNRWPTPNVYELPGISLLMETNTDAHRLEGNEIGGANSNAQIGHNTHIGHEQNSRNHNHILCGCINHFDQDYHGARYACTPRTIIPLLLMAILALGLIVGLPVGLIVAQTDKSNPQHT